MSESKRGHALNRNGAGYEGVSRDVSTLNDIKLQIERATEERTELWHKLSQGHDPALVAELHELDERIERLWSDHRAARAQLRFGDRDRIIDRARREERIERAA